MLVVTFQTSCWLFFVDIVWPEIKVLIIRLINGIRQRTIPIGAFNGITGQLAIVVEAAVLVEAGW